MQLSLGDILLGGPAVPLHRRHCILRRALTIVVTLSQIELSLGVILFGRFAIPLHGFHKILLHFKLAKSRQRTQLTLGFGIALFRFSADVGQQLAVRLALLGGQL